MKRSKPLSALILIASILLLSGEGNASAESQKYRSDQHKRQATPQAEPVRRQEPQVPLSVWQATESALHESLAANKQQAITAQKQAESNQQTFCSPAVVVNEILALIGAGYLFFMYLQWSAIDEQARTAQKTLDAIKNQAEIAERELIITNRAYLYLSEVTVDVLDPPSGISEGTAQIKITYPIYNGGQTPALFIGDHSRVSVGSSTADIRGNYTLDRPQTAVVPPRGAHPLNPSHTSELSYEEFNDVKDRRKTLYFSGVLTYLDMFDKERHTWFTLSYTGPAGYKFNMAFETAKGLNRFD